MWFFGADKGSSSELFSEEPRVPDSKETNIAVREAFLEPLSACVPQITAATDQLEACFADRQRLESGVQGALVHDLIINLRAISNRDYRNLAGVLNDVRLGKDDLTFVDGIKAVLSSRSASQSLQNVCQLLLQIDSDGKYLSDTAALLRFTYKFGVTIRNPQLIPGIDNHIDANDNGAIYFSNYDVNGHIALTARDGKTKVSHIPGPKSDKTKHFKSVFLSDGESVLSGRQLSLAFLYGRPVDATIPVECALRKGSDRVSRGSLLIIRDAGKVFFFDRGTLYKFSTAYKGKRELYEPKSMVTDDGYEFGVSDVGHRP